MAQQIRRGVRRKGAARIGPGHEHWERRELPRSLRPQRGGRAPAIERFCHPSWARPRGRFPRRGRPSRRLPRILREFAAHFRQASTRPNRSFILLSFCLRRMSRLPTIGFRPQARNRPRGAILEMSSTGSVTKLILRVKQGDRTAAQELLARYFRRLLGLARAKLQGKQLRAADEEDVVQSALIGFFLGAERGQYAQLRDRDDLWHLLVKITIRKAQKLLNEEQRQKRCPGTEHPGTPWPGPGDTPRKDEAVERVADPHPSPDLEVLANETIKRLLQRLEDTQLRAIAVWKWEGYTIEEMATMLGCSSRTILRKLKLIRAIWREEEAP